jgi:diguanylate cyclase (GGDEF)-like protein
MSPAPIENDPAKKTDLSARVRRRPLAFEKHRSIGTPAPERFDRIVRLARRVCDVPVATIELGAGPGGTACVPGDGARPLLFRRDIELFVHRRPVGVLHLGDFVPRTLDRVQEEMLRELASLAEQQIGESVAQRALAEENDQLRKWAFVDELTSVWNRHAIWDLGLREVEAAARDRHQTVGLIMIDLDLFKRVNDSHGHAAGDAVLQEVSARLRATIRATDAVGRYGGEEFLVVMPDCSLTTAVAAAERIRQAIAEPIDVNGASLVITATLGVAVHRSGSGSLEDTVRAADRALYRAKAHGRNRVAVAPVEHCSSS